MSQPFIEVTVQDQRVRDAAIAAMGQRLAAAGPRTRRKVTGRTLPAETPAAAQPAPPAAARIPALMADRSHAFTRNVAPIMPPSPRRRALTAIGRTAALAAMASAGFAVVLLAQSPRWSAAAHHLTGQKTTTAPQTAAAQAPLQQTAPASLAPAQLAQNDAVPPVLPAARAAGTLQPPPMAKPVVMPPWTEPPAPAPPESVLPARPRPVQIQLAAQERAGPAPPRPIQVAVHHEMIRPWAPHPVVLAHYSLPHWLTDARDTARPLIMSPPPHDLQAPAQTMRAAPAAQQASASPQMRHQALPPLPRPRLIYASAGYEAATPYRPAPMASYGGAYGQAYPLSPYGYQQAPPYRQ